MNKVESISFPRSGHKFTTDLLHAYFGPSFRYGAESPDWPATPDPDVDFLKRHDFDLRVPIRTDRFYLVQVRDPFDAIWSWYQMTVRLDGIEESVHSYRRIFSEKMDYWSAFVRKWVLSDIQNRLILKYRDLVTDPEKSLTEILRIFAVVPDRKRVRAAVEAVPVIERRTPQFYLQ